jgi:hypothetical protein
LWKARTPDGGGRVLSHIRATVAAVVRSVSVALPRHHSLEVTVPMVPERLRLELTEFRAVIEVMTISAAIRPYSMAVTPDSSLISLLKKITIGLHSGFSVRPKVHSKV